MLGEVCLLGLWLGSAAQTTQLQGVCIVTV